MYCDRRPFLPAGTSSSDRIRTRFARWTRVGLRPVWSASDRAALYSSPHNSVSVTSPSILLNHHPHLHLNRHARRKQSRHHHWCFLRYCYFSANSNRVKHEDKNTLLTFALDHPLFSKAWAKPLQNVLSAKGKLSLDRIPDA
jgi:hypothetical protein